MLALLAVAAILAYLVLLWYFKVYKFNRKLARFPLPPRRFLLGHALLFADEEKGIINVLHELNRMYGDTVRVEIGPQRGVLLTTDVQLIEFVLSGTKIMQKSDEYRYLDRWLGSGLLTSPGGAEWRAHRKLIAGAFRSSILDSFIPVIEDSARLLVEKLHQQIDQHGFDIFPYITLCSLDIICETAMGTSVNAQVLQESNYVRSVKEMCRIIVDRAFSPLKIYDFFYLFSRDRYKEKRCVKVLHDYTNKVIRAKMEEKKQRKLRGAEEPLGKAARKNLSFLDLLLEEVDSNTLQLDDLRKEVDTFMFAGHDTTSSALSFAIYSLAHNYECQERAFREQRDIFGNDLSRPLTPNDLKTMKYLDLVIKETLRLYPSVPFYARKTDKDIAYDRGTLPKGLAITIFAYALQRNPKYYPDPEKFDPGRFEHQSAESNGVTYVPFSIGPRNCIGQKYAAMEMKAVLSLLLRNFEFLPSIPDQKLQLTSETVLISKNGIFVRLKQRDSNK